MTTSTCWCCRKPPGQCRCQDETAEVCHGCNHCTDHCRCRQLRDDAPSRTRSRAAPAPHLLELTWVCPCCRQLHKHTLTLPDPHAVG
jgi:hypothetical protein